MFPDGPARGAGLLSPLAFGFLRAFLLPGLARGPRRRRPFGPLAGGRGLVALVPHTPTIHSCYFQKKKNYSLLSPLLRPLLRFNFPHLKKFKSERKERPGSLVCVWP